MRLIPILLIASALALAGCAKKDDGTNNPTDTTPSGTTPTGTTPTGTTPTGTTPTGTTPTGTTPTTPTTPTTVTPKDLKSGSVSFPDQCSTVGQPAPCPSVSFTPDSGYTMLNLTVSWACTGGAPACASNSAAIKVGSNACAAPASIDPNTPAPKPCSKLFAAAAGKVEAVPDAAGMTATWKLVEQ